MIPIESLTDADKGRKVVYQKWPIMRRERGVISSWNESVIFVRYGADLTAKATRPEDLEWVRR
jgi:hypothetical protein